MYDRGGKAVEACDEDFFWPAAGSFPFVTEREMVPVFDFIGEVHGPTAQAKAMCQPVVLALDVWPGRRCGTALLRRRWGMPEIAWVSVRKECRGHGLGRSMVLDLLARCNTRYVCAVTSDPSVVPFWEKCGFHVAEEIPEDK